MTVPRALTIAGSDSGGGAGIQADLKVFFALGVHGMSAITALTAQNTQGVSAVEVMPPEFVREQISQVVGDIGVDATKTGMLATAEIVTAVAEAVEEFRLENLVVDPVFVSKNKDRLLSEDAVGALLNKLFPLATIITPNLDEAGALLDGEVTSVEGMIQAARALYETGTTYVLVKGGDLRDGPATDVLFDGEEILELEEDRIDTLNTHGTGCTLASAIAAHLARGESVPDAVKKSKEFVTEAIRHSLNLGKGYGPVNPGWSIVSGG